MFRPSLAYHGLLVLREVYRDPEASQRSLARATGVSAATVNGYIATFLDAEWIFKSGDTNRTIRYALTPRGELRMAELENNLTYDLAVLRGPSRRKGAARG